MIHNSLNSLSILDDLSPPRRVRACCTRATLLSTIIIVVIIIIQPWKMCVSRVATCEYLYVQEEPRPTTTTRSTEKRVDELFGND